MPASVSPDDLRLLAYLGETHQEIELLSNTVPMLLGDVLANGDLLLLLGAGDIGHVAQELAEHGLGEHRK